MKFLNTLSNSLQSSLSSASQWSDPVWVSRVPHKETQTFVLHFVVLDLEDHQRCHCFYAIRLVKICHPDCWLTSQHLLVLVILVHTLSDVLDDFLLRFRGVSLALSWGVQVLGALRALLLIDLSSITLFLCASLGPRLLSVASCNVTSFTALSVRILLRSHGLSITPKGTTPEIVRSASLWLMSRRPWPARCSHGILHCAVSPQQSSALCCVHLSSLRLLAVVGSTRPEHIVKRISAFLVNLLFTTVFR